MSDKKKLSNERAPRIPSHSCRCCCSLRGLAIVTAFVASFVLVINPLLDDLIDPLDPFDETIPESPKKPFDPSVTDIMGYSEMGFVKEGTEPEINLGFVLIAKQSFPRWLAKVANWIDPTDIAADLYEKKDINILDARKDPATFVERGFTLLDMSAAPSLESVQNWRSPQEIEAFQKDLEPHLLGLFPDATRVEFTYMVVRGGSMFGDQPAAVNGPHLDYSQNDDARRAFHDKYPPYSFQLEPHLLMGNRDTESEEMKVLLGIWKPIMMKTTVCDNPLAIMDARTFQKEHEGLNPLHMNFGVKIHNLNGAVYHHDDQKWYYYPFQEESEVLVFTQYSKGKHFANPHGSFQNPNCPEDSAPRISVELRAAVFFPK